MQVVLIATPIAVLYSTERLLKTRCVHSTFIAFSTPGFGPTGRSTAYTAAATSTNRALFRAPFQKSCPELTH